jgi:ER lumen protein retaining receptor
MLQNSGNVDNLTGHYVFFLGCGDSKRGSRFGARSDVGSCRAYRALYLLNWIYRYFHEPGYRHWIGAPAGGLQRARGAR